MLLTFQSSGRTTDRILVLAERVTYCSIEHQRLDWNEHSKECSMLVERHNKEEEAALDPMAIRQTAAAKALKDFRRDRAADIYTFLRSIFQLTHFQSTSSSTPRLYLTHAPLLVATFSPNLAIGSQIKVDEIHFFSKEELASYLRADHGGCSGASEDKISTIVEKEITQEWLIRDKSTSQTSIVDPELEAVCPIIVMLHGIGSYKKACSSTTVDSILVNLPTLHLPILNHDRDQNYKGFLTSLKSLGSKSDREYGWRLILGDILSKDSTRSAFIMQSEQSSR
jgi:hypothetical protein